MGIKFVPDYARRLRRKQQRRPDEIVGLHRFSKRSLVETKLGTGATDCIINHPRK